MSTRRLLPQAATLIAVALVLAACGSNSTTGSSATPTPTVAPCTKTVVFQGEGSLPHNAADFETFTTTTTSRLDAFLDWTFTDSVMAVFVYQGTCTFDQFKAQQCDFLLGVASPPKPLKSSSSANIPPGTYGLILVNANTVDESVSVSVTASSAGCPAVTSVSGPRGGQLFGSVNAASQHALR